MLGVLHKQNLKDFLFHHNFKLYKLANCKREIPIFNRMEREMKNKAIIRFLSIVLLCALMLASFVSCTPGGETETGDTVTGDTEDTEGLTSAETKEPDSSAQESTSDSEGQDESESQSNENSEIPTEIPTEKTTDGETEPDISDIVYSDGEDVKGAGATFEDGAFALEDHEINESAAIDKTAAEMLALLSDKDNMTDKAAGKVYRVTEPLVLAADTTYYGNFSALIAEGGIIIEGNDKIVIKDLIIKGNITIKDAKNITLYKVDISSADTAVTADKKSSKIEIEDSIIKASDTAINVAGNEVYILGCVIEADKGIVMSGDELEVQHSKIKVGSLGISANGDYCTVKNNTIESENKSAIGISYQKGSYNGLVALNDINGIQESVKIIEGYNCVVLLNSAVSVTAEKNTNVYVVNNSLGGAVILRNNTYLLCDGNSFIKDSMIHPVINTGNSEFNGDGLQDLSARPEHGANEDILPHTNKDLFIDMARETRVRDISLDKKYSYNEYIRTLAAAGGTVIVPPGVYSITSMLELAEGHSNATIYAFGVYQEKKSMANGASTPEKNVYESMGKLIEITGSDIAIHGLTFGYDFQSAGQVYVLDKFSENGKNYVRVVTSAGYYDGFGYGDTKWFAGGATILKGDELFGWRIRFAYKYTKRDTDGTMILEVTEDNKVFSMIEKGDILGCRLQGDNNYSIYLKGTNTLLKDCVLYGYSAALAICSSGEDAKGIRLERFHNTVHSAPIIDKATYEKYKALEEKYGMTSDGENPIAEGAQGLEVYVDAKRRYRGGLPRLGSVDGTHITGAAEGLKLTSCIFEQMVDDGSNHRSSSSRIAGVYDNGDGTTTIYYKGSVAMTYYNLSVSAGEKTATPTKTSNFRKGDKIFAYASNGHTLIEAEVLSDAAYAQTLPDNVHLFHKDSNKDCVCDFTGCGAKMCFDHVNNSTKAVAIDCKCDVCGKTVHTDYDATILFDGKGNGKCNGCKKTLSDTNNDGYNDSDNAYIIYDMASEFAYNSSSSMLSYKMHSISGATVKSNLITYSTPIMSVKVKTADLDMSALDGYDLLDNDYFMDDKVICDNLSLNSAGFSFDNVLYANYHCRGILPKTVDSNIKNCTFRNVACAGLLMSTEGSWGESTVPKNITIEGCLFDNTGYSYDMQNELTYAPISISGLGELSADLKDISADTLPCNDINIIGNKFVNMNNNYILTISAAQNVTIKDNVFTGRETSPNTSRVLYMNGCLNVELSDNIYNGFGDRTIDKLIVGWNYKDFHGTDIEGTAVPSEKGAMPTN